MRRLLLLFLVPVALITAQASHSRALDTAANVTITGAFPNYTVTLTGVGSDPIKCMRFFAPAGVTFTVSGAPAGTNSESPAVFSNGGLNVGKDQSATWVIKASGEITAAAPPKVNVSSNCVSDVPALVTVKPAGPNPPLTGACKCVGLTMATAPTNFTDSHTFEFAINWTLKCTGDAGVSGTCRGGIVMQPPRGSDFTITTNRGKTLACAGKCGKKNSGTFHIVGKSKHDLELKKRRGKSFEFTFILRCAVKGQVGKATMLVVFDKRGFLDRKKSKFK